MMDEDLIYWRGIAIGCVEGDVIVWFANATDEAIAELTQHGIND